jgi:RNA polymerase sigma-70 factor, ECF subfamily
VTEPRICVSYRELTFQEPSTVQRTPAPHNSDRADDVLGEIMLRIHRNIDRVEDHEHLTRWV